MTFRQAIIEVLKSTGRPLTTAEVADAVITSGLVSPSGKTPEATVGAELYTLAKAQGRPGVPRLATEGQGRAVRGSVRWTWER